MALPSSADRSLVAGIGDLVVSGEPSAVLVAYGLGSCVAVAAWDPFSKIGGLAHFMLPSAGPVDPRSPVKYVGGGLEHFIRAFRDEGGNPSRAHFKVVGGAATLSTSAGLQIGQRNSEAVIAALASARVRITATDLGGSVGRTVQLHVSTGRLLVRSVTSSHEL